jgi:hypothetical protein
MLLSCSDASPEPSPRNPGEINPSSRDAASAGTTLIETDDLSVAVPSGWQLKSKTSNVIKLNSEHGELTIRASRMNQPLTLGQLLQVDLANARELDRNARVCGGPIAARMPDGPADGRAVVFCYVYPSMKGYPSFDAEELWFEAVNSGATIHFAIRLLMEASDDELFVNEALPVIRSVHWKVSAPTVRPSYDPRNPPHHAPLCLPSGPGGRIVCS